MDRNREREKHTHTHTLHLDTQRWAGEPDAQGKPKPGVDGRARRGWGGGQTVGRYWPQWALSRGSSDVSRPHHGLLCSRSSGHSS